MKSIKAEVKSGGPDGTLLVVDVVEIPEYETLDEARTALGDVALLELANTQNATNIKNAARSRYNTKPTKQFFQDEAMKELLSDGGALFQSFAGDLTRLTSWRETKVKELEAKYEADKVAKRAALAQTPPEEQKPA